MHVSFKLNGDTEVIVQNGPGGSVNLEIYEGVYFGGSDEEDTRKFKLLSWPKAQARAIASTIMGCAAES
jgi:hypothetical protein